MATGRLIRPLGAAPSSSLASLCVAIAIAVAATLATLLLGFRADAFHVGPLPRRILAPTLAVTGRTNLITCPRLRITENISLFSTSSSSSFSTWSSSPCEPNCNNHSKTIPQHKQQQQQHQQLQHPTTAATKIRTRTRSSSSSERACALSSAPAPAPALAAFSQTGTSTTNTSRTANSAMTAPSDENKPAQSVMSSMPLSASEHKQPNQPNAEYAGAGTNAHPTKIDGKAIAADIRNELKARVQNMTSDGYPTPGLAVILVGDRRDSQTYVRMKKKACDQTGIRSFGYDYRDDVTQEELLARIHELNQNRYVHGILVQLPLPQHLDEDAILNAIHPSKDVDGLHPINIAKLALQGTHGGRDATVWQDLDLIPFSVPCTPLGCIELLDRTDVTIAGKHAVVIGRSNLVGLPVSFLLLHRNATVTIVHSKTNDIQSVVRRADIVIAAVGRANIVKADWIKPGAVVIDVGINSVDVDDPNAKKPYKLVGDVDYDSVAPICSKITPVPGGVGPMTIAMLLRNTVNACRRAHEMNNICVA